MANVSATGDTPREWPSLIHGELVKRGTPLEVRSPFDGSLVGTAFESPAADIEQAVHSAESAFGEFSALASFERSQLLRRIRNSVQQLADQFVRLMALEAGKPVKAAKVEVDRAIFNLGVFAEEAERLHHEYLDLGRVPSARGKWGIVRRFPLGAIYAITPFNFPLNLVVHKVGPSLASGNTMLQKPSPKAPLCSLLLARIANEAQVLRGALNVLCFGNEAAEKLAADARFRLLTFTGSSEVGWQLKAKAGKKRVALELGGNAGVIVHSDADTSQAAARCAQGGFSYAGQSCVSVQRIYAHRSIHGRFLGELVDHVRELKVGNPLDPQTDVGPLITREAAERVEKWVKDARSNGAKLLCGGKREGSIVTPTVLTNTQPQMKVACAEVFGPVVIVEPYDSFDEALATVNASPFGLQAGVFTNDVRLLFRAFEKLEVGGVIANDVSSFRADDMPYGGMKDSGTGREGAQYAIESMTERKILVLNLSAAP
jgi:acyl-CoA reductase-like NAD-dependent aldehyde dehydrogenase